ncbi:phosphoesterase, partial [Candidatus Micrarchaeota archaeon]|nr:phosphoesterase [Candidatus Micrarchaeota archaeon]
NIPVATEQEFHELPNFLKDLQKLVEVIIVKGNHDGNIERFSGEVKVYGAGGLKVSDLGIVHGHAWPSEEVMKSKYLVMGHNHPQVEFRDKLGRRYAEKAWVIGSLKEGKIKVIVMPAFNPLVGGISFNRVECNQLLGPIFKNELFKLEDAKVRLLNGIELGKIKNLKVS